MQLVNSLNWTKWLESDQVKTKQYIAIQGSFVWFEKESCTS